MKKRSLVQSVLAKKCPKCRQSDLFCEPFDIAKPLAMYERCHVCDQNFEPEPGFYYGAMFVSYILTGFLFVAIGVFFIFYLGWSLGSTTGLVIFILLCTYLFFLRISRSIWIHLMVHYEPQVGN